MGGKAFTTGPAPLSTPRMPPDVYYKLRNHYLSLLFTIYNQAETPIEALSKDSYGDIDILVSQPKSPSVSTECLIQTLAAERVFTIPGSATTSFAVPYPDLPKNYVQVDVHVCPPATFHWQVFQQSHGGLWNLLGTTIRPFGLTANDVGLNIRIAEIEELNRKKSMILLTNEPDAVLEFLSLDKETYRQPFESVEAMYEYVVACRFFRGEMYVRGNLKANDRKRMAKRELYKRFVEIWLPENESRIRTRMEGRLSLTRQDVTGAVLDRFHKRAKYQEVVEEWRRGQSNLGRKQAERQKRKADSLEVEEYTNAWMRWLKDNIEQGSNLTLQERRLMGRS